MQQKGEALSFWDDYKESGGNYLKADEKDVLMENGIPFTVTAVQEYDHPQYGLRYELAVQVPDPESGEDEERSLSFKIGSVESRDRMLKAMEEYLGRDDAEPVRVKLEKQGRSILLRSA